MPPKKRSPSSTPVPSTEGPQADGGNQLPEAEIDAMQKILNHIYEYRTDDGWDPSKIFHRKVNKRLVPDYYSTIQEPMALSTIKQKINARTYQSFSDFVRDFALIPHNAQVFNRPDSGAFQDALVIKQQLEEQLQILVKEGLITQEVAALPDLGEIPTYEDVPMEDAAGDNEEEEESEDDPEEDDDEEQEDLDDEGKPRKKRGRPIGGGRSRKEAGEERRARGRPPKLLTPMEARILTILKGIRKPKTKSGQLMIKNFDRLPDKQAMPEYYQEIKKPISYDNIKRNVKRKKYPTLDAFMADINLMLNNAKEYNQDDSQIFKDAVALQNEAARLLAVEQAKPDEAFVDEDGKIPMPNGILRNGELYKVGDWIHLQNPNDLTKPMPAQIYRTFKDPSGQSMINVCWYYRPEQTVHRFDKHFFTNEIVKTGRYRDHSIDEVEGKCFIMFYTRYFKGRPRGLPNGLEIYVCRDRYNEQLAQFNTIKTWTSCLPDEVRDNDYEMDLFDHTRPMKKHPSPLAYLLKDEQKETDDLPKPVWGADGAPPKIGAVHKRPKGEKDSPPPEPTPPPPPPKVETPAPRPIPPAAPSYNQTPSLAASQQQQRPPITAARPSFSASQSQHYPSQTAPSPAAQRPPSAHMNHYTPSTPQTQTAPRPTMQQSSSYQHQSQSQSCGIPPNPANYPGRPQTNYRDPPPIEVYTLPDHANLSIPMEVREQYQRDEFGRVLFFTTPPVAVEDKKAGMGGHSVRYLAARARREEMLKQKRKERDEKREEEERVAKKARVAAEEHVEGEIEALKRRALGVLEQQLAASVKGRLGDVEVGRLSEVQKKVREREAEAEENERRREREWKMGLEGSGVFGDDWEGRVV